jgi:glycine cleavage system transcriptional repressor
MTKAVITGVGPDQPGMVSALTHVLLAHGANIEDSSMTILAHQFTVILLVSLPTDSDLQALAQALKPLEASHDFSLSLQPYHPGAARAWGEALMISVAGADRTGITHQVSTILAEHQVNITDLNAQTIPGEDGPVYILMIEVQLPPNVTQEGLLKALKALPDLDITLHPLEPVTL